MKKTITIECPYCHMQYLPSEIYLPNSFFGKPQYIEKDYSGKIIDYCGKDMDLTEVYTCDKCNTQFSIKAKIFFETAKFTKHNINDQYVVQLKKKQLMLDEN